MYFSQFKFSLNNRGVTSLWESPAGVAPPGGKEDKVLRCPMCPTFASEGS